MEGWKGSQRDVARIREARQPAAWLRELAAAARRLAEDPHAGEEPVDLVGDRPRGEVPFEPLEVRAAEAAASTLEELADLERLPGCDPPAPAEALEALEDAARAAVARAHRRPRTGSEPLPGARRPRPSPVPGIAPGRRVSRTRGCRPAPRRGAAPAAGHRRADAPGSGARGAVPVPRVRRPPDRAALALVAELGRGGASGVALSVRGRRARPARPGRGGGRGSPEAGPWAGSRRVRA